MNSHDLKFLADRADAVLGRADQRLAEVHARIRSARRRRAAGAAAGASAAVLALAIGVAVLTGPTGTNKDHEPIPPADSHTPTDAARPIVYGDGWPIRVVHVGDRTVDLGDLLPPGPNTPVYLDTTDDGVLFTIDDEQSRIWFTDGVDVVRIGQVGAYTHIGSSRVATGTSGSLAAWPELSARSTQLVVYDTSRRVEVTRIDCPKCGSPEVVGGHVYWDSDEDVSSELTSMYDAATGETTRVPATAYAEDLAGRPRGLLVGPTRTTARPTTGIGLSFSPAGGRLVPRQDHGEDPAHEVTVKAFDTGSGEELDLRVPDGYRSSQLLTVFDWLDDDQLALVADGDLGTGRGEILVCRISTQECELVVAGSPDRRWAANLDFP